MIISFANPTSYPVKQQGLSRYFTPQRLTPITPRIVRFKSVSGLLCLLCLALVADAQEVQRPSQVGERAAELRTRPPEINDYNLKVGPVLLKVNATMTAEFNDNINTAKVNPEADLILTPSVGITLRWQATRANVVSFDTTLGYSDYLFHPKFNVTSIAVGPGSRLTYDIYTGDFRINLHDLFSITDDPVRQSSLSNVAVYQQYVNVIGAEVLWDLNTAILTLGLDHTNSITPPSQVKGTSGNSQIPDDTHATEGLTFSAFFPTNPITGWGINTSASYTTYRQSARGTATSFSLGPFLQTKLSHYTDLTISGGYQGIFFRANGAPLAQQASVIQGNGLFINGINPNVAPNESDLASFYANVSLNHRLNRFYNDSLSFGRENQLGLASSRESLTFLTYTSSWAFTRLISLVSSVSLQDVDQAGAVPGQASHFDQFVAGFSSSYPLSRKLTVSLNYQFSLKLANVSEQGYLQDRTVVQFAYQF